MSNSSSQNPVVGNSKPFTFMYAGIRGMVDEFNEVTWDGRPISNREIGRDMRFAIECERNRVYGVQDCIRIYDNPRYLDRYTALDLSKPVDGKLFSGLSIDVEGFACGIEDAPGFHLGRRIFLFDMSADAQAALLEWLEVLTFDNEGLLNGHR